LIVSTLTVLAPKVHAFSNPYILDVGISYEETSVPLTPPITQTPGGHMRLWYHLYNPNSYSVSVILGASIQIGSSPPYSDPPRDETVTLQPGDSISWPNRYFYVPSGVPTGSYTVIFAIWDTDWNPQYDSETKSGWVNMVSSVSVQLSSSPSNVGTITWDNVAYTLPTSVSTTTRIHWSGTDNIHCTPPSGYAFDYWENTGSVRAWDTSSQWTSVSVDGSGSLKAVLKLSDVPPTLSNGYVTPTTGDTSTLFYYYVSYYDPEGVAPTQKQVCIDGSDWHTMGLYSGSASNGVYRCVLTLPAGSHNYYFKFSDGVNTIYLPSSGTYSGPTVSGPNSPPTLSNGYVTPTEGDTSTLFYYYVHYYDPEGIAPTNLKQLCIDGTDWHAMGLYSGSASDGDYRCVLTLSEGSHNYYFKFSDGINTVYLPSSGTYAGPTVGLDGEINSYTVLTPEVVAGNKLQVQVTVKNIGGIRAEYNVYIGNIWDSNGNSAGNAYSESHQIIQLDPGKSQPLTLEWTTPNSMSPGAYTADLWLQMAKPGGGYEKQKQYSKVVSFTIKTAVEYTLTINASPSGGGSTSPLPGKYSYTQGQSILVTETPNVGYSFDHWDLDGTNVGGSSSYTVTMDTSHVLTAIFKSTGSVTATQTVPKTNIQGFKDLGTIDLSSETISTTASYEIVGETISLDDPYTKTVIITLFGKEIKIGAITYDFQVKYRFLTTPEPVIVISGQDFWEWTGDPGDLVMSLTLTLETQLNDLPPWSDEVEINFDVTKTIKAALVDMSKIATQIQNDVQAILQGSGIIQTSLQNQLLFNQLVTQYMFINGLLTGLGYAVLVITVIAVVWVVPKSPVNVLVTDPYGRRLGISPSGTLLEEIPEAVYTSDGIVIFNAINGEYLVTTNGTERGEYQLHLAFSNGTYSYQRFFDQNTAPGIVDYYVETVEVSPTTPSAVAEQVNYAYTDKTQYYEGDTIIVGIDNKGKDAIILPNTAPWVILDKDGNVVYRAIGQTIPVVIDPDEKKEWQWNQKDDYGQRVPPGIYFFQIETSAGIYTARFSIFDVTPPTIDIISPQNTTYANNIIDLIFTISEPTSWIGYSLDGQANVTITGNTILIGLTEGSHNIVVYANDTSGNMGFSNKVYFTIDTIPPTTSISLSGTLGLNGWYVSNVTVTLTATDEVSGVAITAYSFDGTTWMTYTGPFKIDFEGLTTIYYNSTDNAGNVEETKMTTVKIDKTNPTITIDLTGTLGNDGWYLSDVTVTLGASDHISDILGIEYSFDNSNWTPYETPFTIQSEGTTTVYVKAKDNAGNVENGSFSVKIDKTPPVSTASLSGTQGMNGWYVTSVQVTLIAEDPGEHLIPPTGSGVYKTYYILDGGLQTEYSSQFTVSGQGDHTVQFWSVDVAGNIENTKTIEFKIDTTCPETTASQSPDGENGWWKTSPAIVILSASDATSGVMEIYYQIDSGGYAVVYGTSAVVTVYGNGIHTISYYATDYAGNQEFEKTETVKIDITPPTTILDIGLPQFTSVMDIYITSTTSFTLSAMDNPEGSEVASIYYRVYPTGTPPPQFEAGTAFQIVGDDGTYAIEYYSIDNAGNQEPLTTKTITLDNTPPTTTKAVGTPSYTNYVTSSTQFSLTTSDNGAGTESTYYRINSGSWKLYTSSFTLSGPDGTYTIEFYSIDKLGNIEGVNSQTHVLDNTPPSSSDSLSGTLGDNNWYISTVTVTLLFGDGLGSGVAATYYKLDSGEVTTYSIPFPVTEDGWHTIEFWSVDKLGNEESHKTDSFKIDKTAPNTSASLNPNVPNGENGWYAVPVEVSLTRSDGTSGIAVTYYSINDEPPQVYTIAFTLLDDGEYTIQFWSIDYAGNTETPKSISFKIDKTAPITVMTIGDPKHGTNPTYVSTTTYFTLEAYDAMSKVACIEYRIDFGDWTHYFTPFSVLDFGTHTIYYRSKDIAGNVENTQSICIFVKATSLTYFGDTSGQYSDPASLKAKLLDMATQQPISGKTITFTLGSQTVAIVTDSNGIASTSIALNQPSGVYTVSVTFIGDEDYFESSDTKPFTIERENAIIEYTGDTVVPTTAKTINLRATVVESKDSSFGDLTKIKVTFSIYSGQLGPSYLYKTVPAVPVSQTGTPGVGVAMAAIANLPENGYLIVASIDDNAYYSGPTSDATVLTIYLPTGSFVTGGGWIWDPSGSKGNFGFNVKYAKSGNIQGQSIYVYREGEWDYVVKSNAWTGLAIEQNHAYFEGKCVIQKYNPTTGEILWAEGNCKFRVDVWDNDSNGGADVYQIRVRDKNGVVFHQAGFDPYGYLQGGNIVIHDERRK
jgi:hypothetical protein